MQIFFSVGEPSGDEHAAGLIRELQRQHPGCECVGFGGENMEAAGCRVLFPLTTMAVMGIMQVLPLLRKFWNLGQQARQYFREHKPDAVVLVDFPGFNWWIAAYAKREGIPVFYYMPPQLWAWGSWRVKRVHKYVDHVLSGLTFETEWYKNQGVPVKFVGHPFFEEVAHKQVTPEAVESLRKQTPQVIALLPGSRKMEVTLNWPAMLEVATELTQRHPNCRFLVANYKPEHRNFCEQLLHDSGQALPMEFHVGKTSEIIEAADCCLMVSGSVSLELLARRKPAVVLYKGGVVMMALARLLLTCKFMTLPNLISGRMLYPEFPFVFRQKTHVQAMTAILDGWLADPASLQQVQAEIEDLASQVARSAASPTTAAYLLETLSATSPQPVSRAA